MVSSRPHKRLLKYNFLKPTWLEPKSTEAWGPKSGHGASSKKGTKITVHTYIDDCRGMLIGDIILLLRHRINLLLLIFPCCSSTQGYTRKMYIKLQHHQAPFPHSYQQMWATFHPLFLSFRSSSSTTSHLNWMHIAYYGIEIYKIFIQNDKTKSLL